MLVLNMNKACWMSLGLSAVDIGCCGISLMISAWPAIRQSLRDGHPLICTGVSICFYTFRYDIYIYICISLYIIIYHYISLYIIIYMGSYIQCHLVISMFQYYDTTVQCIACIATACGIPIVHDQPTGTFQLSRTKVLNGFDRKYVEAPGPIFCKHFVGRCWEPTIKKTSKNGGWSFEAAINDWHYVTVQIAIGSHTHFFVKHRMSFRIKTSWSKRWMPRSCTKSRRSRNFHGG